jgi:hypothetical protein
MLTTLISTLTTPLRTIFSTEEIPCASCRMLRSLLDSERQLTRELLGLSQPTPTPSEPLRTSRSSEPEPQAPLDALADLPPHIRDALMREYAEHLSLYPGPTRVHPEVEQIIPGQTLQVPEMR